jgi:hypothetical protein
MPTRTNSIPTLSDYIAQLQQEQQAARAANESRLREVTSLYDDIIAQFSPGGSFGKGVESQLAESKKSSMSEGTQALVNSGFANSTMMANLGTTWEKKVGNQARLNLEDMRTEKLASAKAGKASMIERVQDEGPDDSLIASLIAQASQRPATVTTIAPSRLSLDSSSRSRVSSPAPAPSSSSGFNSPYWNNGQWTGGPSSSGSASSSSMDESEFQNLVNSNMKRSKTKNNYSYWPEGL